MGYQIRTLKGRPNIIIGTPGRILDHLRQRTLDLRLVNILVLDEADRMLDMGFAPQVNQILEAVPKDRQTMLFSATMPDQIVSIARQHMRLPVRVEIARSGTAAENVEQEVFIIPKADKARLLDRLLQEYRGSVLVFMRTKHTAKRLTRVVRGMGHTAAELHSNRSLSQRREALEGFKNGRYRVLVATDIAARGIDVQGIELVVNYDLPMQAEDYVHRIGRTGRAGLAGRAISFAMPDQRGDLRAIERLIRTQLSVSSTPELPPHRPTVFEHRPAPGFSPQPRRPIAGGRGHYGHGQRRRPRFHTRQR